MSIAGIQTWQQAWSLSYDGRTSIKKKTCGPTLVIESAIVFLPMQVIDNYLETIDNILEVDAEVIRQSQMETGASSKYNTL